MSVSQSLASSRQAEQFQRFLEWAREHGNHEGPVQISTYLKPHQQARLRWLRHHCWGAVLSVGCSWGYDLAVVNGDAGVDINPDVVAMAQVLARTRVFAVGDARALPYKDRSFDTVILSEVLEHLPWEDVPLAVAQAFRVTRNLIIITTPDGREDTEDATNGKHRWLCDATHAKALTAIVESYGDILGPGYQVPGFFTLLAIAPRASSGE